MTKSQQSKKFSQLVEYRRQQMGRKGLRRKPPRWLYPSAIERFYIKTLNYFIDDYEILVKRLLIARLPSFFIQAQMVRRSDDFVDDIKRIMEAIALTTAGIAADVEKTVQGIALQVADFNDKQYKRVINSVLGVDPIRSDPYLETRLKSFARQNAVLIKSIPEKNLKDIEGIIQRGLLNGATVRDMERQIVKSFKVTRARARLIARDQTGKLNSQLTKVRQERIGINEYIWNDVDDRRVRNTHAAMDGRICRWDDPTVYRNQGSAEWKKRSSIGGYIGHPGEDFQCRCFPEPILEDIIDG